MQVELDEAVHQDSRDGGNSSRVQRARQPRLLCLKILPRLAKEQPQKDQTTSAAEYSRFRERFQVIVVDMVHYSAIVDRFVARIDTDDCAQAATLQRVIEKNAPC